MRRVLFVFVLAGLAVANAKTYSLRLYQPTYVGGQELKAGDYKLDVQSDKAIIKAGKTVAEAPVKVESNGEKYASTVVRMTDQGGKMRVQEIRLGGTHTRLVFSE